MCPDTSVEFKGMSVDEAHKACMARTDTTTQYATFHQWTFDRQSCTCTEEPTTADPVPPAPEEVPCPDTSVEFKGMSVDEAHKACMARTDTTTQYATFHHWTFDRQSCTCEEEPTTADPVPPPPHFDCTTKEAWSAAKRAWCCGEMNMGCDGKEDSEETKRLKQQARLVRKAKRARARAKREARQQAKKLLLRLAEEGGVEGLHSA